MAITWVEDGSSLLDSPADILMIPVNCVPGVMGKGLALAAARRWPLLVASHRVACNGRELLRPGSVVGVNVETKMIILAATKDHWRDPSQLRWVESICAKMEEILATVSTPGVSIAVPALGCGAGQLSWVAVRDLIVNMAERSSQVNWWLYPSIHS